jgi:hypothetical protein
MNRLRPTGVPIPTEMNTDSVDHCMTPAGPLARSHSAKNSLSLVSTPS